MHSYHVWVFVVTLHTIRANFDIDVNLLLKICNMKFCDATKTDCDLNYCNKQMSSKIKFGDCPRMVNNTEIQSTTSCFDDCLNDYRCSSSMKCCWINSCNRSCTMAENLNRIPTYTLPSIPYNVSVTSVEHEMRRKAKLMWLMQMPYNFSSDDHIEYIIEARAHIGNTFSKHKLGSQWFVLHADHIYLESVHSHYSKLSCWILLQIGRFYEFRIAALNGNGTRGYSDTAIFQLNEKPKALPVPTNLTIDSKSIRLSNNSVYTRFWLHFILVDPNLAHAYERYSKYIYKILYSRLVWQEPNSEYPIEKYEVTYSRYINEDGNGSLFMERLRVPVTQNFMEFNDLVPDSCYYVQVNALSSFGRKKIRSDKVPIIINTTISIT